MKRRNRFERGSGLYVCRCCGRKTRSTGQGDNENVRLCAECYDLAGMENRVLDGSPVEPREFAWVIEKIKVIEERGGNGSEWRETFKTVFA